MNPKYTIIFSELSDIMEAKSVEDAMKTDPEAEIMAENVTAYEALERMVWIFNDTEANNRFAIIIKTEE